MREVYFMKKKYSLDYSIESEKDRLAAVQNTLDQLNINPSNTDLEQMASYILYGKDENGQNAIQRHEMIEINKRYNSFTRKSEKNKSLDEIIDNPIADNQLNIKPVGEEKDRYIRPHQQIRRPKYDKKTGALIDPGDSDVPGM